MLQRYGIYIGCLKRLKCTEVKTGRIYWVRTIVEIDVMDGLK
jgi:hypothetical protein